MSVGEQLDFFIDGHKLKRVDRCKYPGSYVTKDCKLDEEITAQIQAASCVMGRVRDRVFDCRELTVDTKFKVYNQCIIPLMMNEVKPGPYIVMTLRDQFLRSGGITLSTTTYWNVPNVRILRLFSLGTDCVTLDGSCCTYAR